MQLNDGYTDVPRGKIANVATCLEMFERPPLRPQAQRNPYELVQVPSPDAGWYRDLFRRVGEPYLWFSRLVIPDEQLLPAIRDPRVEVYALRFEARDEGLLELDFRVTDECELRYFGVTGPLIGSGAGRWLMNRAIERAWAHPIKRFWVHTCTMDHPGALAFYRRSGFTPFKRQIEYADDPRLTGALPRNCAPDIPLL